MVINSLIVQEHIWQVYGNIKITERTVTFQPEFIDLFCIHLLSFSMSIIPDSSKGFIQSSSTEQTFPK